MTAIDTGRLRSHLDRVVGPAPWYWKTFPEFSSASGRRFAWRHHGDSGPLAYMVSLVVEGEADDLRLALNTYCRPFLVPPHHLGIWCPEGRSIRLMCFDPDQLKSFDLAEIAGWFKQSSERIYAATEPAADFEVSASLTPGVNKIDVPLDFQTVEELIIPTHYPAIQSQNAAMALYVFYPHAGLLEVLPQKWFTVGKTDIGYEWITRAARDAETHRIFGDGIRVEPFLLAEDGCSLDRRLRAE